MRTKICARFKVFTVVQIQVVFWVVTPYSFAVGYQRFGGPCCLHLQGEMKMEVERSFKTLVSYRNITLCHNPQDLDLKKFVGKLEGKRPLGRPRPRWEDNSVIAWSGMNWVGTGSSDSIL
jgi:hypothetical protein